MGWQPKLTCHVIRGVGRVAIGTTKLRIGIFIAVAIVTDTEVGTRSKYGAIAVMCGGGERMQLLDREDKKYSETSE